MSDLLLQKGVPFVFLKG